MLAAAAPTGSGAYDTPSPSGWRDYTGAAAGAGAKSNGTKLTVWGWQSFTPAGDKALGDQMQAWGSANNTQVEYVVVENSQFPQKLAAAVEAKAPPDVVMLTAASNVIDYASRTLLVDVSDVWKATSSQAGVSGATSSRCIALAAPISVFHLKRKRRPCSPART